MWSVLTQVGQCPHQPPVPIGRLELKGRGLVHSSSHPAWGAHRSPVDTGPARLTKANMRLESHSESALLHIAPWAPCLGSRTCLHSRQVGHSPANPASPPAPLGCWSGSHTDLLPAFCLLPLISKFVSRAATRMCTQGGRRSRSWCVETSPSLSVGS